MTAIPGAGQPANVPETPSERAPAAERRFLRSRTNRVLAGVCGGIAEAIDVDPILVRLVFALLALAGGAGIALYVALWLYMRGQYWVAALPLLLAASLVLSVLGISAFLWAKGVYPDFVTSLRYAAFNTVSVATNTGYATADYAKWPVFAPLWLMFLGTFVACSGSAGGGIKMIRAIILSRQMYRELTQLAHPKAINPLKINDRVVPNQVVFAVLAFFFAWLSTLVGVTLLLAFTGLDVLTAFSASVASLNNIGPGLHEVGPATNFSSLSDFQTWICSVTMLLGRLELLTVLVILTPSFWRK